MKKSKTTDSLPRTPASNIPREVAARCLITTPKLSHKSRKRFKQALGKVVNIECAEPKTEQETYCRKLQTWTLWKLGRRIVQNRARICRLLRQIGVAPTDKIYAALAQALSVEHYRTEWIKDEIASRIKPVKVAAKPAPFVITQEQIEAAKTILAKQSP